ncbi:hypothetical protein C7999DRAFT_36688 [Corynascus novoguineensis]|uniref:Uncharacterized protein n=1 Tax=Corynascus novoguineensis TaxID=1126955 RepID=A0AAN7HK33_9PEZI|nr:hypothetical protein C7999DRAFT_36688 [Corynascus novoguineensis]
MPSENGVAPRHSDAAIDPNAAARQFALAMSENELYQQTLERYHPFLAYPPERPHGRVAWDWLRQQRQRDRGYDIHVPEVFRVFTRNGITFIIMELLAVTAIEDLAKTSDPTWV